MTKPRNARVDGIAAKVHSILEVVINMMNVTTTNNRTHYIGKRKAGGKEGAGKGITFRLPFWRGLYFVFFPINMEWWGKEEGLDASEGSGRAGKSVPK